MTDDFAALDRHQFDGVDERVAQFLDQFALERAAEDQIVEQADRVVVRRYALADHHMVAAARPGHSRS